MHLVFVDSFYPKMSMCDVRWISKIKAPARIHQFCLDTFALLLFNHAECALWVSVANWRMCQLKDCIKKFIYPTTHNSLYTHASTAINMMNQWNWRKKENKIKTKSKHRLFWIQLFCCQVPTIHHIHKYNMHNIKNGNHLI